MFQKYSNIIVGCLLVAIIYASNTWLHGSLDLTAEKRYSLSDATKKLLDKKLDSAITIEVFLSGNLPADYKKLNIATAEILETFAAYAAGPIQVSFVEPGSNMVDEEAKVKYFDSLAALGVVFERTAISEGIEKSTSQLIVPSALVRYGNRKPVAVDLRSSKKIFANYNVIEAVEPKEDKEATRNAAEALLEYKFAAAIDKVTKINYPTVAYLVGNGQPTDLTVSDLAETLRNDYNLGIFDLKSGYPNASDIDLLLIVKPTAPFTEEDQLKIDQYILNGGKVIWFVDKLHAELDSLMRTQAGYTAYDRGLNIDPLLFKYGVRINGDLVQDLNCAKLPIVVGKNPDGSPTMQRIPWPYYPFLTTPSDNPITKNMDRVLPIFPSSIDTVKAPGIKKTILLATDTSSRSIASPAMVSLNSVQSEADLYTFTKSHIPVAVLLEGKFSSLFANSIGTTVIDSVRRFTGLPFLKKGIKETKQIVVSDADIVTNAVTKTTGPLPMGELPFEAFQFANKTFLLNAIDYLVNDNGLFESRNKVVVLRLLDKQKVADQKTFWQLVTTAGPILILLLIGIFVAFWRKKKYL
ncbi:MAG: gliding motility-associated ABC transporter substrate-binding protein GldG [Sediminibacterium sp.]|nr:gliding motility-associated ABC transporter substrate-binding protein GldG [Sediminibacterium sp.]